MLLTVEELNYICEVHRVAEDDVPVGLDQSQSQEEAKLLRGDVLRSPDRLPRDENVVVQKLSLEVQQEPAVAKVKVRVVAVLVHQLEHFRVQNLDQRPTDNSLRGTHLNWFYFLGVTSCWRSACPWHRR